MAKKILILVCMCVASFAAHAETERQDSIIGVDFGVKYTDPTPGHGNHGKTPVAPPSVSIDGHTLYLYGGCEGATLQIVDALGVVVYTEELYATATEVELPEFLSGDYELQILRGNFYFYAEITL